MSSDLKGLAQSSPVKNLPMNLKYFRTHCHGFLEGQVCGSMSWDSTVPRWCTEPCIVNEFLGVLVLGSVAMTKHHDHRQFGEERVYFLYFTLPYHSSPFEGRSWCRGLSLMAFLVCCLIELWTNCPRWHCPPWDGPFPINHELGKCSTGLHKPDLMEAFSQ